MIYSSSNVWAEYKYADQFFFVKRQLFFASLGTIAMIIIMFIPYVLWKKYAKLLLFFCFVLLLLVVIPGFGIVRGGAHSWIGVGVFSIQPFEFMNLGLVIFLAELLSMYQKYLEYIRN